MTVIDWFMTDDPTNRIAAFTWFSEGAGDPMTVGRLTFAHRDEPGDIWGPPKLIAEDMTLATARALATGEGFTVEKVA